MDLQESLGGFEFSFCCVFFFFLFFNVGVFLKPFLLFASLELSMKATIRFLAEFPKEMKLLQLAWLSVRLLLCL